MLNFKDVTYVNFRLERPWRGGSSKAPE